MKTVPGNPAVGVNNFGAEAVDYPADADGAVHGAVVVVAADVTVEAVDAAAPSGCQQHQQDALQQPTRQDWRRAHFSAPESCS